MISSVRKHVFISYVREDEKAVDGLCSVLEAAHIPYWRDKDALGPGDAWKAEIQKAIRDDSLVFLACFSDSSRAKLKTHMNEELTLAVDEFRKMPPEHIWLIPVRFDDGEVPQWDLGAGRSLGDLNFCDLFGDNHVANAASLVTTIYRLLGEKQTDTATSLAAVEQISNLERTDALKRMTKEMLSDSSRRIELDELISQEVQRVCAALSDSERYSQAIEGTQESQIIAIAEAATEFWVLVAPFCASLQVAARWAKPEDLTPWVNGIRSFVSLAQKSMGGNSALLDLRHLPGVVSIMTAGLACVSSGKWDTFKVLVVDQTVRERYQSKPVSILEATSPYFLFNQIELAASVFARSAEKNEDSTKALKHFTEKNSGKYYTPIAEWMHAVLRPIFVDQLPDEDTYSSEFDKAEVILGVLGHDAISIRVAKDEGNGGWVRSKWFGRSTWRVNKWHGNPLEDFEHELQTQGENWKPLQAQLFGGSEQRANTALIAYNQAFTEISKSRW